jgi:hypothetical protein
MPINFELTFTQPLLLDLMNAKFADVQDYANAITKYYVNTIETGMPIGIPPTMPSPAASGAPAPVGTGPTDAFQAPYSTPKEALFNETVFGYFNLKDLIIANGSLASKKAQLEGILRKAEYQTKLIENKIKTIKDIKKRIETAPADIKNTIEGIKVLFDVFLTQIINVKADILGFSLEEVSLGEIDIKAEFSNKFPDEAKIIDSLLNINFGKVQETINTIQTVKVYFNKIKANTQSTVRAFEDLDTGQQQDYVKARLTLITAKIFKLANGLLFPESLAALILDLKKRGEEFDDKALRVLGVASVASQRLGFIKFILEPEIAKLEEFVRRKKIDIKKQLEKGKVKIEEAIEKKAKEIAEKNAKKPATEPSKKKLWLKKQGEKVNEFKKENEDFIKTTVKNIQTMGKIVSKSTALINSGLKIKDDVVGLAEDLKVDFERNKEAVLGVEERLSTVPSVEDDVDATGALASRTETSAQITKYFTDHGAEELLKVVKPIVVSLGLSYLDVKKVTEKTDKKYGLIVRELVAMEAQFYDLENEAKKLEKLPPLKRKNAKPKKAKKERTPKKEPIKIKFNIMSVIAHLKKFLQKIEAFIKKQAEKVKRWLKKQEVKLKVLAERVELAIINSLPIPTEGEAAKTKKEAAEEKKAIIKANVIKVKQTAKKAAAAAMMGDNAVKLGTNISEGNLAAADNEPLLKKISSAKFDFFTVGVASDSPAYKQQEYEKKVMDKEIATLKELDTYVSIILVMANDIKSKAAANKAEKEERLALADELEARARDIEDDPTADDNSRARAGANRLELLEEATALRANQKLQGFVQRLKDDYSDIVRTIDNTKDAFATKKARGVSPIIDKLFSIFEKLFKEDAELKVADVMKSAQELLLIAKSSVLSETLQSQPLLRVLRNIESDYLKETNIVLTKMLGFVPDKDEDLEAAEEPEEDVDGVLTNTVESIKRAKREALDSLGDTKIYKFLLDLHRAVNEGRGSVLSILIEKIVMLLNKFEGFVKTQINRVVAHLKKKIEEKIAKNKKKYEEKLKANAKKKINLDLIGQTIAFNIAVMSFWTGSSWINSVGTMFQIITLPPFPLLKVNGTVDGQADAIRELAKNLENQLPNISGLCIPAPALGIPPFPFKGYK